MNEKLDSQYKTGSKQTKNKTGIKHTKYQTGIKGIFQIFKTYKNDKLAKYDK